MARADDEEVQLSRELARQLATLSFAMVAPPGPGFAAQAVSCRNILVRLGLEVPLVAVADFTQVLGEGLGEARPIGKRGDARLLADRRAAEVLGRYEALLRAVADTPAAQGVSRRALTQEMLAVLLARLLGDVWNRWTGGRRGPLVRADLPLASAVYTRTPAELALEHDPGWVIGFLAQLVQGRELLLARAEQLDLGPLRLLGMFPATAQPDLLELYRLMNTPAAGRAVDFSLQLLPSILETKRSSSSQRYAIDGYASVERRGSIDAILPSEMAHDADIFAQKVLSDELLYYGHERQQESVVREHWILVDSSASMRGTRESFARGLAIALGKKLHLQGDTVCLRFFDTRLHRRIPLGAASGHELPHVLCFRSERGRHYQRAFEDLLGEARRLRRRGGRALAITFITHGECHVPAPIMDSLAEVARLYGVFVMPSQPLALSYLGSLARHQVVNASDFAQPQQQKARALDILEDVAGRPRARTTRPHKAAANQ